MSAIALRIAALIAIGSCVVMCSPAKPVKEAFPFPRHYFVEVGFKRMVEIDYGAFGEIRDCYRFGKESIIKNFLKNIEPEMVTMLDRKNVTYMVNKCTELLESSSWNASAPFQSLQNPFHFLSFFTINAVYPGTKWCGPGDVADNYNDLGPDVEIDKCCREHDHCNDSIEEGETKHCLKNINFFTVSHCDCDGKLRKCLSKVKTLFASVVGNVYFNVLGVPCFKKEYPVTKCLSKRASIFFRFCQRYEVDKSRHPIWQFFDPTYFSTAIFHSEVTRKQKQTTLLN